MLGDLAIPSWSSFDASELLAEFDETAFLFNLEGPLIERGDHAPTTRLKHNLSNDVAQISRLPTERMMFGLANNHYADFPESATIRPESLGLVTAGTRQNARMECEIGGRRTWIYAVSFPAPDPLRWRWNKKRLNCRTPQQALKDLRKLKDSDANSALVVFVHWGYEFSEMPYPADRAWARRAADLGVDLIVGHHPHVAQPVERFGRTVVAYSLGNFLLPEGQWHGKPLGFRGLGDAGLALLWDGTSVTMKRVVKGKVQGRDLAETEAIASFSGMTDREYRNHFIGNLRNGKAVAPRQLPILGSYDGYGGSISLLHRMLGDSRQALRDLLVLSGARNPYRHGLEK
jgi:hypothetical protein